MTSIMSGCSGVGVIVGVAVLVAVAVGVAVGMAVGVAVAGTGVAVGGAAVAVAGGALTTAWRAGEAQAVDSNRTQSNRARRRDWANICGEYSTDHAARCRT